MDESTDERAADSGSINSDGGSSGSSGPSGSLDDSGSGGTPGFDGGVDTATLQPWPTATATIVSIPSLQQTKSVNEAWTEAKLAKLVGALDNDSQRSLTLSLSKSDCERVLAACGEATASASALRNKLRQLSQHYNWHTLAHVLKYKGEPVSSHLPKAQAAALRAVLADRNPASPADTKELVVNPARTPTLTARRAHNGTQR